MLFYASFYIFIVATSMNFYAVIIECGVCRSDWQQLIKIEEFEIQILRFCGVFLGRINKWFMVRIKEVRIDWDLI